MVYVSYLCVFATVKKKHGNTFLNIQQMQHCKCFFTNATNLDSIAFLNSDFQRCWSYACPPCDLPVRRPWRFWRRSSCSPSSSVSTISLRSDLPTFFCSRSYSNYTKHYMSANRETYYQCSETGSTSLFNHKIVYIAYNHTKSNSSFSWRSTVTIQCTIMWWITYYQMSTYQQVRPRKTPVLWMW